MATIPPINRAIPSSAPAARIADARAAFFRQALTQTGAQTAAPPNPPVQTASAPVAHTSAPAVQAAPTAPPFDRPMRPGSIINIRV